MLLKIQMKKVCLFASFLTCLIPGIFAQGADAVLVEAESFEQKGGWFIDQQSMDIMGSPYLIAHGIGTPVDDARTMVRFPSTGSYYVHVRTRNWTAPWTDRAAGQFQLIINGKPLEKIFGAGREEWSWTEGGKIKVRDLNVSIALHDLTGFDGRCDAIYFTRDKSGPPPDKISELEQFRDAMLGPQETEVSKYDLVVIGGGMAGTCAAISAARLGLKVALIQNRPVLGGNNSSEVRVHLGARIKLKPYPALGNLVNEIGPSRGGNAQPEEYYEDDRKLAAVLNEPNISLFLDHHANEVEMEGDVIIRVFAEDLESGRRLGFEAPLFADCTGDGSIGYLAGAEYMSGREARDVFNENTAPETGDELTMGLSVQWFSIKADSAVSFPDIDWGLPWDEDRAIAITRGDWDWETGMGKDMIRETELIRDYGLLVVFSNWSFLKNDPSQKDRFAKERLEWVAYIGGKRESRRLVGEHILTENDLIDRKFMPDGTASTTWTIDLHYPDEENRQKFDGEAFRSIAKHTRIHPYPIPFRCLYSKNVTNLMMAGRNISVSHVALGTVRLMRTGGMMGEVLGMAASVCTEHKIKPRDLYPDHFKELQELMLKGVGDPELPDTQNYNKGATLMETR